MKKTIILITVMVLLNLFTSCGTNTAVNGETKIIVAVTIPPQKAFVNAVCGDLADVVVMVPPGNSPENYDPTPMEIAAFSDASVYFSVGVPTESANILPHTQGMNVVDLAEKVTAAYPDRQFEAGERDPHIWLSPKRAIVMVKAIAEEMSKLDPHNAERYLNNAQRYNAELDALDSRIQTLFKDKQNQTFIVNHPAFGYIAEDYHLNMVSLEQEGKESTPKHLQVVVDLAKQKDIHVIFTQVENDSTQPDAFIEEIGGEKAVLNSLSEDYIDNFESMASAIASSIK